MLDDVGVEDVVCLAIRINNQLQVVLLLQHTQRFRKWEKNDLEHTENYP